MEHDLASNNHNDSDTKQHLESSVKADVPIIPATTTQSIVEEKSNQAPASAEAVVTDALVQDVCADRSQPCMVEHSGLELSPNSSTYSSNVQDGNATNASTEVLVDQTISERFAKLDLLSESTELANQSDGDEASTAATAPAPASDDDHAVLATESQPEEKPITPQCIDNNLSEASSSTDLKTSSKDSLENSARDGYNSLSHQDDQDDAATNNSEQSVKIDRDVSSDDDYVEDKDGSPEYNQEMSIEDQDEDVEEEEEFHEVEEDKHKSPVNDKTDATKSAASLEVSAKHELKDDEEISSTVEQTSALDVVDHQSEEKSEVSDKIPEKSPTVQKAETKDWAAIMSSSDPDAIDPDTANEEDGKGKQLDHDEDVNNPQYVPKKGMFYEHDDRGHDSRKSGPAEKKKDESEIAEKKDNTNKKPVQTDKQVDNRRGRRQRTEGERWNHDRYRDDKQKPRNRRDINTQGYERTARNQSRDIGDQRLQKTGNERPALVGTQENQSRLKRGGRGGRDIRSDRGERNNRSGDRRGNTRRQERGDMNNQVKRDLHRITSKPETTNTQSKSDQQTITEKPQQTQTPARRDQVPESREFRDRGSTSWGKRVDYNGDKSQAITPNPMQNITTWSNKMEENLKEEANRKEQSSINPYQQQQHPKGRSNDLRHQINRSGGYNDRSHKSHDDRHRTYHSRNRYQDRDDSMKMQLMNKQNYGDRQNHQPQDSQNFNRRMLHYSNIKSNDCDEPIKTQTYENSRLSQQASMNRNFKDAREIINEKRMQQQQQQLLKTQLAHSSVGDQVSLQNRQIVSSSIGESTQESTSNTESHSGDSSISRPIIKTNLPIYTKEFTDRQARAYVNSSVNHGMSSANVVNNVVNNNNNNNNKSNTSSPASGMGIDGKLQKSDDITSNLQPRQIRQPTLSGHQATINSQLTDNKFVPTMGLKGQSHQQHQAGANSQHHTNNRNGPLSSGNSLHYQGSRQQMDSLPGSVQDMDDHRRQMGHHISTTSNSIQQASVSVAGHSHTQHSHSHHRLMGNHMSQQNTTSVGSHLGQYYNAGANSNSRDAVSSAAALAASAVAYGYMPNAQPMVDTSRYHMNSQLSYMASGQTSDVAASLLHQGMYPDSAQGAGTPGGSSYLASGSSSSIPVTGTGPPLGQVLGSAPPHGTSYLQHSQYQPGPYSSHHYPQSQPGQGPQPGYHAPPAYGLGPSHPTHPNSMQAQSMSSEDMFRLQQSMTFYDPSTQHTSHRQQMPSRRQKATLDMDSVAPYGQDPAAEYSY